MAAGSARTSAPNPGPWSGQTRPGLDPGLADPADPDCDPAGRRQPGNQALDPARVGRVARPTRPPTRAGLAPDLGQVWGQPGLVGIRVCPRPGRVCPNQGLVWPDQGRPGPGLPAGSRGAGATREPLSVASDVRRPSRVRSFPAQSATISLYSSARAPVCRRCGADFAFTRPSRERHAEGATRSTRSRSRNALLELAHHVGRARAALDPRPPSIPALERHPR